MPVVDEGEIISHLRAAPDEVEAVCRGLSDEQLRRRPATGEWSLLEVCCHLRDAATEEGVRVRRMVEEDNPTLEPYDQEARAAERRYAEDDPHRVLMSLRAFCSGLAYQLEHLTAGQWDRPGFHPETGPTSPRQRSERQVAHVRDHLEQMRALRRTLGR